jgi:hypothetical protein
MQDKHNYKKLGTIYESMAPRDRLDPSKGSSNMELNTNYINAIYADIENDTYESAQAVQAAYQAIVDFVKGQADEMSRGEWVDFLDIKED